MCLGKEGVICPEREMLLYLPTCTSTPKSLSILWPWRISRKFQGLESSLGLRATQSIEAKTILFGTSMIWLWIFILLLQQSCWLRKVGGAETREWAVDTPSEWRRCHSHRPARCHTEQLHPRGKCFGSPESTYALQRHLYVYTSQMKCIICSKASRHCLVWIITSVE